MHPLLEWVLSNTVVAGALAALAYGSVLLKRPALTHVLWVLVVVKLLTPPVATFPVLRAEPAPVVEMRAVEPAPALKISAPRPAATTSLPGEGVSKVPLPQAEAPLPARQHVVPSPAPGRSRLRFRISPVTALLVLWACGSLLMLGLIAVRVRRFGKLLRHAERADGGIVGRVERLCERLGLRRHPQVLLLPGRLSPMLWSLGLPPRARLLLPKGLLATLSGAQLDTLLAHELAHLKRRDHLVRLVELVAVVLLWWHPLLHVARRQLHHAEELACDGEVLWALDDGASRDRAGEYAAALVSALSFISPLEQSAPPAATGLGHLAYLKRRLTMILNDARPPRKLSGMTRLSLAAAVLALPLTPTLRGQEGAGSPFRPGGGAGAGQKPKEADSAVTSAARALIEACLDPEAEVRSAAFSALVLTGADAAPAIIDALNHAKQRHVALSAAQVIGWRLAPALGKALDSRDPALRASVAEAISQLLQPDKHYPFPEDPAAAHGADGGRGGPPGAGSAPVGGRGGGFGAPAGYAGLPAGFDAPVAGMPGGMGTGPGRGMRFGGGPAGFGAASHGGAFEVEAKELARRLAKAVTEDDEAAVRRHAAAALGKLPGQHEIAGPAMMRAAADKDPQVRKTALAALSQCVSAADAVEVLAKALADSQVDAETRQIALLGLSGLGREARLAIPALVTALKDKDPQVRRIAADAIGAIQSAPEPHAGHGEVHDPNNPVPPGAGTPVGRPGK